jgi:hypothetical protein
MQPSVQRGRRHVARLAIVMPRVLLDHGCVHVEVGEPFERQAVLFEVLRAFGGVEFDLQAITVATQYAEINAPVVNDRERPPAVGQGSGFASGRLLHEVAETLLGANGIPATPVDAFVGGPNAGLR